MVPAGFVRPGDSPIKARSERVGKPSRGAAKRNGPSAGGTLRPGRKACVRVIGHDSIIPGPANRSRFEPVCSKLDSPAEQNANAHSDDKVTNPRGR